MLDQLIKFAQDKLQDKVKGDNNLDDRQTKEVFNVANGSLLDVFKQQAGSGNFKGLMDMFNGKSETNPGQNPIAGGVNNSVIKGLMDKLGIDEGKAGGIASQIVPTLINRFASKDTGTARNANDLMKKIGLDGDSGIQDALKNFGGNKAGGLMGMLKGLFGGR